MKLTPKEIQAFQSRVWTYYAQHRRDMPWRTHHSLYYVIVSELMLQQTQVSRVISKFEQFIVRFPDAAALAVASLSDVLVLWQGLGYNRRAKYLHESAQIIARHDDTPFTYDELCRLPGIGVNTAGAILAYVYNQPVVFVETNIRTVYFHEFFANEQQITDAQIREVVAQTLESEQVREWYYALMDYGAMLKKQDARLAQSRHYKKQSPLRGSLREMRGMIIRALAEHAYRTADLHNVFDDERYETARDQLVRDGLIEVVDDTIRLTETKQPS